jgi:WD40 repeat protein
VQLKNDHLASDHYSNRVDIWNIETKELANKLIGHSAPIRSFSQMKDSEARHLISGSCDWTIKIWDRASGIFVKNLTSHQDCVNSLVSLSNHTLISCSADKTIKIWDIHRASVKTLTGIKQAWNLELLSSSLLASGLQDGSINILSLEKGKSVKTFYGHESGVNILICKFKT